ncbi:MAG: hypothetical protein J0H47_11950 [Gammaproteobacteria bacterium]|nr:hypothetical protein [Gammaproteobacteria bacterium]
MLDDTLKFNTQNALSVMDEKILDNAVSTKTENKTSKPVAQSLAKDILAILALKPEMFF